MKKPISCLDFDGVIHSYTSGWQGADVISDPIVPGALHFIWDAQEHFEVHVFSSRSHQDGGIEAMKAYLWATANSSRDEGPWCDDPHLGFIERIQWPTTKPPAMISIDDRALTFKGHWPLIDDLKEFQPWTKKSTTKPSCSKCIHSVFVVDGVMEVPGYPGEYLDRGHTECRKMPPVPTFWGSRFPTVTDPCSEFKSRV